MRSILIAAAGVSFLLQPTPAHAREVRRLAPSSRWVVNYAEDNCRLARSFGTGSDRVDLLFDRFFPGESLRVTLAGTIFGPRNVHVPLEPGFRFGPAEDESKVSAFGALLGGAPAIVAISHIRLAPYTAVEFAALKKSYETDGSFEPSPIGVERERAATWFEVNRLVKNVDLVLETGRMDRTLDALRQCSWDTVRAWGMDPDQQKKLKRGAWPTIPLATLFNSRDYPRKMAAMGQQGIVNVRLIIDEQGRVESCTIQRSTRPKEFDDVVCANLTKRARFSPALDENGKPIRSYFGQNVIFRMG